MGSRIVTTDVEIIDAVTTAVKQAGSTTFDGYQYQHLLTDDQIHAAAHNAVRALISPPTKTSDITGFKEDDE